MNCQDADLSQLGWGDESSQDYLAIVHHVDTCTACQARVDAMIAEDAAACEFSQKLRSAGSDELTVTHYHSTVTLQLTDDLPQAVVGSDAGAEEVIDLDFLGPATHPELLGRLGRYDIERVIGTGGMGIVFRAFDTELHRVVALKVLAKYLSTNAAARRRFAREAQAAAAVLHPNVLPIHNVEADGATPYLVMQYVSGQSLQARVDRDGPLDAADVLRIAKQTAEALAAAHHQGLIHRDVKPANILLEDETDRVVLGDFGLARATDDASLTRTGIVAGTPHYMSPEQASGEAVSAQSDLFSLGSVMYFMLTGHPPFRAESAMSVLHCVCSKKHRPVQATNNAVPRELSEVVDRLLSKRPIHRFASAEALAARLEQLLAALQRGQLRIGHDRWGTLARRVTLPLAGVCLLFAAVLASGKIRNMLFSGDSAGRDQMTKWQSTGEPQGIQDSGGTAQVGSGQSRSAPAAQPTQTLSASNAPTTLQWQRWLQTAGELSRELDTLNAESETQLNLWELLERPDTWPEEIQWLESQLDGLEQSNELFQHPLLTEPAE